MQITRLLQCMKCLSGEPKMFRQLEPANERIGLIKAQIVVPRAGSLSPVLKLSSPNLLLFCELRDVNSNYNYVYLSIYVHFLRLY